MFRFRVGQAYLWRDGTELTLIDAGDIDAAAAIEDAIRTLGLDPAGIRRIVITHGHRDHYGTAPRSSPTHWTPRWYGASAPYRSRICWTGNCRCGSTG